ncbi:unnamed protein product (mitochondrion) [Plasmodiophora brassicae]|uniref:ABC transporter domain-containing protein n=2 Tax=Plasmodiophora brassicae TaxID=37360 RepID=A0A3P3YAX7_PLABS|nr:unnamed protein product [Plasmodiophora brassicae]
MDVCGEPPAIVVRDLSFQHVWAKDRTLKGVSFKVETGSRVLLCGRNGAGKSTLLQIIAGSRMISPPDAVRVLGYDSFDASLGDTRRVYVSNFWGQHTVAFSGRDINPTSDLTVAEMTVKQRSAYPDRAAHLQRVLGVDLDWSVPMLSDGQRRRAHLFIKLIPPWDVLLLDEVTASLDLVYRTDFLEYIKGESTGERKATVIYATHILEESLDSWATDILYLNADGTIGWNGSVAGFIGNATSLRSAVLQRMRDDVPPAAESAMGHAVHEQESDRYGYHPGRSAKFAN